MTVYVHFNDRSRTPVRQHNIASIVDAGAGAVTLVNAFGGEPKRFSDVRNVAVEPEREAADDEPADESVADPRD